MITRMSSARGGIAPQISRSPLTRHFGLHQWHCDLLRYRFQALQIAVIQDTDAVAVQLVLGK